MSKTVKRLLWQRTLDRTVLRQPLPRAEPQPTLFMLALKRFCEEINAATPGDSAAGLALYLADMEGSTCD